MGFESPMRESPNYGESPMRESPMGVKDPNNFPLLLEDPRNRAAHARPPCIPKNKGSIGVLHKVDCLGWTHAYGCLHGFGCLWKL